MPARSPLQFGISVTPYAEAYPQIVEQVLTAERGGFELVGIQDHPYQRRFLDTFSLIADLLARTSRLRFFPDVASLPMRPPTMLAKAAASLDVMSGGRFELGLGAGTFWDAVAGMGGPRRAPGERGTALEEAVDLVRAALDVGAERGVVRGAGPFYPIAGYPAGPPTAHRVEIWIGAMAPRALELIGRKADGWIPAGGVSHIAEFAALGARIDDAAHAAGRDPRLVRRIVNVMTDVTPETVDRWIDQLSTWAADPGVDAFVFWPSDAGTVGIERLAAEVIPAVRAATAGKD
ncbi:MAG TPA: LLM class flavin-dependent oxidoreductase [Candidatus Limnocylindrales bacterium]|nr:LLM class flavin-dependent oxidoreductase [Candidatus Limnocylindrales bacterium]